MCGVQPSPTVSLSRYVGNGGKTISFTTTSDELMQALDEAGLGHLPDSLPIAYTKRGSYDKTILRLARAIYEGGSIAAQVSYVPAHASQPVLAAAHKRVGRGV